MIKYCVHAVFCKSPDWLQVIRSLLFCVPVQAKPKRSMCSHPSQSSCDQAWATVSQEASLAALGIAAKSDLFRGMYRLFLWHTPASCNQHGTPTKHLCSVLHSVCSSLECDLHHCELKPHILNCKGQLLLMATSF